MDHISPRSPADGTAKGAAAHEGSAAGDASESLPGGGRTETAPLKPTSSSTSGSISASVPLLGADGPGVRAECDDTSNGTAETVTAAVPTLPSGEATIRHAATPARTLITPGSSLGNYAPSMRSTLDDHSDAQATRTNVDSSGAIEGVGSAVFEQPATGSIPFSNFSRGNNLNVLSNASLDASLRDYASFNLASHSNEQADDTSTETCSDDDDEAAAELAQLMADRERLIALEEANIAEQQALRVEGPNLRKATSKEARKTRARPSRCTVRDRETESPQTELHEVDSGHPEVETISAEVSELLRHRASIWNLEIANQAQQEMIQRALETIKAHNAELHHAMAKLRCADTFEAEDSAVEIYSLTNTVDATLPLFPALINDVPLFRLQADERAENHALTAHASNWLEQDRALLRDAVIAECKRVTARRAAYEGIADPFAVLEDMTEDELLNSVSATIDEPVVGSSRDRAAAAELAFDWELVAEALDQDLHDAEDCRTRWLMNSRTGINNEAWSPEERARMEEIVNSLQEQKKDAAWETVAEQLNTGRTGVQCLTAYQRKFAPGLGAWTEAEDKELLQHVKLIGPKWAQISMRFSTGRDRRALSLRYNYTLQPTIKRGKWTPEEDALLKQAVSEFGEVWREVTKRVPGRTGVQCRERWVGRLSKQTEVQEKKTYKRWTPVEDAQLRTLVERDLSWVAIASMIQGGERSDKQCRERWIAIRKREEKERQQAGPSNEPSVNHDEVQAHEDEQGQHSAQEPLTGGSREERQRWICSHEGCTKRFVRKSALEKHLKASHGEDMREAAAFALIASASAANLEANADTRKRRPRRRAADRSRQGTVEDLDAPLSQGATPDGDAALAATPNATSEGGQALPQEIAEHVFTTGINATGVGAVQTQAGTSIPASETEQDDSILGPRPPKRARHEVDQDPH